MVVMESLCMDAHPVLQHSRPDSSATERERTGRASGENGEKMMNMRRYTRKKAKHRMQRWLAICCIFVIEIVAAAASGGIAALILMPLAYEERGYYAFGGEIVAAFAVTVVAYFLIHKRISRTLQAQRKRSSNRGCDQTARSQYLSQKW